MNTFKAGAGAFAAWCVTQIGDNSLQIAAYLILGLFAALLFNALFGGHHIDHPE